MNPTDLQTTSVADAYLALLASRGVDYLFANAGTDFAPLIEALAKAQAGKSEGRHPRPLLVPHENVAVAMAHGYYMATGRVQAVMVHVGLGTANAINGLYNAARQNVPILFTAGRTPILESGVAGSRNNYINWAQELFDQAAMVRELMKWDYELRHPLQLETVVDRALALATSEPQGPVYLTLPREVLAAACDGHTSRARTSIAAATPPQADATALAQLAAWLRAARAPLIITSSAGRKARQPRRCARLRSGWQFRWCNTGHATCACPSRTTCTAGSTPRRCCPSPIWCWCSNPTCHGYPTRWRRTQPARWCIWASTRSMRATPSAAFAPIWPSLAR